MEVLKWAHVESQGHILLKRLEKTFGKADLIQHFSNKFDFKVAKANHSIGWVFGFMEQIKIEFTIGEYQATQTTLEQIFNMFAVAKTKDDTHVKRPSSVYNEEPKKTQ